MRLLRKVKTAFSFSGKQWKLFLSAYALLLRARFLVQFFSARAVEKALAGDSPREDQPNVILSGAPQSGASDNVAGKKELLDLFRLAWRYQWRRPRCLATALAQQAFLARSGYPTALRIGVRKDAGSLKGHAWCEELQPSQTEWELLEQLSS